MLELITGGVRSSREKFFTDRICTAASSGEDVLVIVPDQFSFEYDKKLYNALGARLFNKIETMGFDRLAQDIVDRYGSKAKDTANENAMLIMMYKAVKDISKNGSVRYYKKSLNKPTFIDELLDLIPKLRRSGITPQDLSMAAVRLEGTISLKLLDISQIYQNYIDELEKANMKDALSVIEESSKLAWQFGVFKDKAVFVSSFNDFSYDERKLLEQCITSAKSLTVSLLLDSRTVSQCRVHPFDLTLKTQQQLIDCAEMHNIKVNSVKLDDTDVASPQLKAVSTYLYNNRPRTEVENDSSVQLFAADDMYEEADFICAEICRLVRENAYSYNDIAVTLRNMDSFSPIIESALEKYDIPYFIDKHDSIDASAIVHYIDCVFKTVLTGKFRTDNIIKLIKSPLFSMLNYEISDLEDYCIRWGVDGDMWLEDFTAAPEKGVDLERINTFRISRRDMQGFL